MLLLSFVKSINNPENPPNISITSFLRERLQIARHYRSNILNLRKGFALVQDLLQHCARNRTSARDNPF